MTDYVPGHKSEGTGPAVLFLHGLGGNRHSFDLQIEALRGEYQCIAWDVPGYGGSQPLENLTFDALAECLNNLIDTLGIEPYGIVGHSLGGMVAQTWLRHGGQCSKVVLAQTSARFGKPGSAWNDEFLAARLQPIIDGQTPADFARQLITDMFHDADKREAIEAGVATMAPLPADVYRQVIECLVTFDESEHLGSISTPTLCLAAEFDRTAPAQGLERMAATIPNARYECLPDAGHLGYIETPEAFTRAIHDFLAVT